MSDDENSEPVTGELRGEYRQYRQGDPMIQFKANAVYPLFHLSNLAVAPVVYDGVEYPSVEHAFQAQKFTEATRHQFSTSGVFGDPARGFESGWRAYFNAKTPGGSKNEEYVEGKKKYYAGKNTYGVLAKMVNNLTRPDAKGRSKSEALGLQLDPSWDFGDAHEDLWVDLLRSKYENPEMRRVLLSTGDAYLAETQKFEKKIAMIPNAAGKKVRTVLDEDNVDFYTAFYDKATDNCKHCNEPRCNSIGKILMKVRDEIKATLPSGTPAFEPLSQPAKPAKSRKRKASPPKSSPSRKRKGSKSPSRSRSRSRSRSF